ncbi:DUF4191 domain-containing protein [Corynebacterium freiburgense]|uniref:DUF4191 domain-containing protein n=1 Tax=Corynebacterium freiburgense TaxID=556548 RepID=UPI0004291A40|nr:DUF4191 domain-containing protein [Corynebacterium freiburgense]WJZ03216.1 hypothetical protein CFREI_09690 [Corynebacterium freiburgense]
MADARKQNEKAAKKQARSAKFARFKQNWAQMWQAFQIQRKQDKKLVPLLLLTIIGIAFAFFLLGLLWGGQWYMLFLGLLVGFTAALYVFTRRVENSVYDKASDQPGAAGWALENLRNGVGMVWKTKTAVAATTQMDAVHRVVGVCGIVLVGEGEMHRVRPLMAQQKKRLARVAGNAPIYEMYAGEGEGQVRIRNLQRELMKLPRNMKKDEVYALAARVDSIDSHTGQQAGLPKGPLPKGARVSGMNRRARRAAERNKH